MLKNKNNHNLVNAMGIICVVSLFCLNLASHYWKTKQSKIVLYPTKKSCDYPLIAYLPQTGTDDSCMLFNFVEEYIHLTLDESMDGYEKTTADTQFKMDYIKTKLERAIYLSRDAERTKNQFERLPKSNDLYFKLHECNCSYPFNIDAIESVRKLPAAGTIYLTVLGHFQVSFNKDVTKAPDSKAYGYKRVHFVIGQAIPERDTKDRILNEYSYYVISMNVTDVTDSVQSDLFNNQMLLGWDSLTNQEINEVINNNSKTNWGVE